MKFLMIFYKAVKAQPCQYPPHLVGFVAISCSFGGKWFGGYARGKTCAGMSRNYAAESCRNLQKQVPKLYGVRLCAGSYDDLDIPPQSLIYCDPPYAGTGGYRLSGFDHGKFWDWVAAQYSGGHQIYVSEYRAPEFMRCVWSKQRVVQPRNVVRSNKAKDVTEKLFVPKGAWYA